MMLPQPGFLPVSRKEGHKLGIDAFDIIIVSGDAYVDHPSFAAGLIGRVLWEEGYTVGIIPQPDWRNPDDFRALGTPRLFFAVSAGNVDSMVNHYTAQKKPRSTDTYSPGGRRKRPDRATLVYSDRLHALFPKTPVIIGGIEASLRRFAHYDYWSDRVRQSILADAPADILVFGMGERPLIQISERLSHGDPVGKITDVRGTAIRKPVSSPSFPGEAVILPSYSEVSRDREAFAGAFFRISSEQDPFRGRTLVQPHPKSIIIQNPPAVPLSAGELDRVYELPFSRRAYPSYREPVPALEPVRFSVTSHRGCFGNCSFCALALHQGCIITSRSIPSVVREVTRMTRMPGWKGIVQDIGGPTANMYGMSCRRWVEQGTCPDRTCGPDCPSLDRDPGAFLDLLRAVRDIPGVRKVFVGSGIRYDLIREDDGGFLDEFCIHHVSGHLKVAPEHITRRVTDLMRKPPCAVFESFRMRFEKLQEGKKKRQYLLPYLMSGHPGCTIGDMVELAEYLRNTGLHTEQVQDFTPTPMTASTCMYYTGLHPETREPVHVPKGREKKIQRALLRFRDRKNRNLVAEGLRRAGREDLIGSAWVCLIRQNQGGPGREPARQGKKFQESLERDTHAG